MERKITKLTSQSTDWQHKAELAVNKEREDLARYRHSLLNLNVKMKFQKFKRS
ncbi:hypothetical protein [Psychrosphaera algicola]|uniref:Uncharacterized protein n=1 Tax=Psychrosphaera algicola TaxID=3023714 RepID=A0ABT5FDJ0_9GAMM|nr:hypothetical protein [Psychrosphaera sp. G1-22]MDC2889615.1 hypothetical protein [Psychrosphaera sp. G1-22]